MSGVLQSNLQNGVYSNDKASASLTNCDFMIGDIQYSQSDIQETGWLRCDGQKLEIQQYPDLYAVIGQKYKLPTDTYDESVYFRLPNIGNGYVNIGNVPNSVFIKGLLGSDIQGDKDLEEIFQYVKNRLNGAIQPCSTNNLTPNKILNSNANGKISADYNVVSIKSPVLKAENLTNEIYVDGVIDDKINALKQDVVLWTGTLTGGTATLSKSIANFQKIFIQVGYDDNHTLLTPYLPKIIPLNTVISCPTSDGTSNSFYISFRFTDNTTIQITENSGSRIKGVYGSRM